jgi:hypothetical protein
MREAHEERFRRVDHMPADADSDAAERGLGQRAFHLDAVAAFERAGLRAREKDRRARAPEIDALGGGAVGQHAAGLHVLALGIAVRGLRPDDGLAVAPRDEEEALADRRRAIVARALLAPLHHVAAATQGADEATEEPTEERLVARAVWK